MMGNDDNIMNIHSSFGTVGTTKSPTTGKPSTTASRQNLMPEVRVEETAGFTRKRPLHAFSENTNKLGAIQHFSQNE
jgi:hypothetical protein